MLPGKTYSAHDIIGIVRRRPWLLPIPVATLFVALVVSSRMPDVYQSSMLIAIVPQRVPDEFVRSTVTLRTEERLDAITVQTKSRTVLEPIINEFDLYRAERDSLPMEDVVQLMRDHFAVEIAPRRPGARESDPPTAFYVRFTYRDPAIAARVTQRLGSIFVDQNTHDRGALAQATDEFLDVQLKEARERLEAQEKLVEGFRERHGNELPTQLPTNLAAIQNAQMQMQALVEQVARDRDRKLMLERLYPEAANEPAIVAIVPPTPAAQPAPGGPAGPAGPTSSPREQLAAARALLPTLEMRLTPQHPDIARTKRLIAELEAKVAADAAERSGDPVAPLASREEAQRRERLRTMQAEIESLDRQTAFKESEVARLRAVVAEYQRRIEAVPGVESEWAVLTRDYDTQKAAYQDLLRKSEASKVAVELENRQIGENFRVLDPARLPASPVSPNRIQITVLGFGVGLALAIGIVVLLELKDGSFRNESEIASVLALPVLVAVPYVETRSERRLRLRRQAMVAAAAVAIVSGAAYVFWTLRLWTVVA
jgi:polysaccharide chain length determinant protein (PEP-CTERM system associated)